MPSMDLKKIDEMTEYASAERPDAWKAVTMMCRIGAVGAACEYLAGMDDARLRELATALPYIYQRDLMKLWKQSMAEQTAAALPCPTQTDVAEEQIREVSQWMARQTAEVRQQTIAEAIRLTAQEVGAVRCKQDWAGILRLITHENPWLPGLTNQAFVSLLTDQCHLDTRLRPTVSSMKVLSFGSQTFPAWVVTGYSQPSLTALIRLGRSFLSTLASLTRPEAGPGPEPGG